MYGCGVDEQRVRYGERMRMKVFRREDRVRFGVE